MSYPSEGAVDRLPSPDEQTDWIRSIRVLAGLHPPEAPLRLRFGDPGCEPQSVLVPDAGCCWRMERGPTAMIERLSVGPSGGWAPAWTCQTGGTGPNEPGAPRVHVTAPPDQLRGMPWKVQYRDFSVYAFPSRVDVEVMIDGDLLFIPSGAMIAKMDFYPNGLRHFVPVNRLNAVAQLFAGFDELFHCVDEAGAASAWTETYLMGDTHERRLADFSWRLGFHRLSFGELGWSVIGDLETIRRGRDALRTRTLRGQTAEELLMRRAERDERAARLPLPTEQS